MKKLSNKLSVAILQALDDLEQCMNDDNYVINFDTYHRPVQPMKEQFNKTSFNKCSVCYAGSVIAKRLKPNSFNETIMPSNFNEKTRNMLYALDNIRNGYINAALSYLDINEKFNNVEVNQHDYDIFKSQMIQISNILKENKL